MTADERIFLSAPDVRDLEVDAVVAAIESNWLAPVGPALNAFEGALAEATGRKHAIGLTSGTAALHLALLAAGARPGSRVYCSSLTFIGSASPIVHLGAHPVFIDSESHSWNIDPGLLRSALTDDAQHGRLPAAVVVVDLYGNCADYAEIVAACAEFEVPLIEDAAEALGATYRDAPAGSFGTSAILSFNGNKIITSSGGGALVTDDESVADRARYLSTQARQAAVHYEHTEIGFNYRMSNVLAALGHAQLTRLDERIERRTAIHARYTDFFEGVEGAEVLQAPQWGSSNHWLSCVTLTSPSGHGPSNVIAALDARNIESRPIWKPMHLQPVFADAETHLNGTAEHLFGAGMCLPSGSGMTDVELDRVIDCLDKELL